MTATATRVSPNNSTIWNRELDHYPKASVRFTSLGIVVVATIVLYYQFYLAGAVAAHIITDYHMSFVYYVNISVAGYLLGALASFATGLSDRYGRANIITVGLFVTGMICLVGIPNAHSKLGFAILFAALGMVEGVILVATPALIRDFSPQIGRASAMAFWTMGPVLGSLLVTEISSHTLDSHPNWQFQFRVAGIVGLVVFAIAAIGLRELSPRLRDQLMVSMQDKALIEARAAGIDVTKAIERPWRQMMTMRVVGSAFAISVFLIIYYTAVGFFTIYFTTIYGFSLAQANGIGNWFWGIDALSLIVVGVISDRLAVRKPFMLIGGLGAIVMTIVFLGLGAGTGYYTFVWVISVLAVFMAVAYAPWMASFTETVERINPALTATGLAVWGWIIRAVVALSVFALPFVVTSMTPLVQYGTEVATLAAKYEPEIKTLGVVDPATLGTLGRTKTDPEAGAKAIAEIMRAENVDQATALQRLQAAAAVPKADLAFLQQHAAEVQAAAAATPGQWQNWWWVCVGGEAVFLPLIFVMVGRWRPKQARADLAEHQARVDEELEQLSSSTGGTFRG